MKFLVTGAGGFIGSHVVEALVNAGHQVRALVRYNSRGSWGHLEELASDVLGKIEVRLGDVTDSSQTRLLVEGTDVVLHLAALIGIPYSYHAPASYIAHQRWRHTEHSRSVPPGPCPPRRRDVHQRGLWHCALHAD